MEALDAESAEPGRGRAPRGARQLPRLPALLRLLLMLLLLHVHHGRRPVLGLQHPTRCARSGAEAGLVGQSVRCAGAVLTWAATPQESYATSQRLTPS